MMNRAEHREHLRQLQKMVRLGDWTPPDGLSAKAQNVWRSVVPHRARSAEKLLSLEVALQTFDRLQAIDQHLKAGELVKTTPRSSSQHAHPLLGVERALKRDFLRHWTSLNLHHRPSLDFPDWESIQDPESVDCSASYSDG